MDSNQWQYLLSDKGQQLLAKTAGLPLTEANHLQAASSLRKQIDPHLAQAVVETVWLRQRAHRKFSLASEMYFTREALEQSSSEIIASYRAGHFHQAGFKTVADLGCGIGGDSLALAAEAEVFGIELDQTRLAMAQENVRVYGHAARFFPLLGDLMTLSPLAVDALFFDPARRDQRGKRLKSIHQYRPPLTLIDQWRTVVPNAAVKISPGVNYAELPADAEVEFISVSGEVKEGVLWYGDLRRCEGNRATLLPQGHMFSAKDFSGSYIDSRVPDTYLYEPDGAIIRAHLIQPFAHHLGAHPIDPTIAYLTAGRQIETPFARCFAIEDWLPFQLKRLRHYLRAHNIGRVTIKKRGSPLDPATLQRQLRLQGDEHRILFLTRVLGEPAVLIAQRLQSTLST